MALTPVLAASSTGASNTSVSTSATVLVAPVLAALANSTCATSLKHRATHNVLQAPMLETHC